MTSPREIRDMVVSGQFSPEDAIDAFRGLHQEEPPLRGEVIIAPQNEWGQLVAVRQQLREEKGMQELYHFHERKMLEEKARHALGLYCYGLIGLVDGVADAVGYGISEFAEDVAFTVTRTARKAWEGAKRGWQG